MITVILDGVEKHSHGIMGGMLCADSPRGVSLCVLQQRVLLGCGMKPAVQLPDWKQSLIERCPPHTQRQRQSYGDK